MTPRERQSAVKPSRRTLFVLLPISGLCAATSWACGPAGADIVYASPKGSGDQCSQSAPCSLLGARDKVRTMNAKMSRDIVVRLADGVYRLIEPFELVEEGDIHDSGSNGHVIRYEAAPSARPILSGGTRIHGWTLFDEARSIYRAVVPKTLKTRQLYVKGVRAVRARGRVNPPNCRKNLDPDGVPGFFTSGDAADAPQTNWKNPSHIEIVSRNEFMHFRCPLESIRHSVQNWMASSRGPSFSPAVNWPIPGSDGVRYHAGDFNGDGRADLLLTWPGATTPGRNAVAFSVGTGFAAPVRLELPARANADAYQIGDFDGNGRSDLLVAHADDRGRWHNEVFLSDGWGAEKPVRGRDWLPDEGKESVYRVGDFNGDGRSDLLLASRGAASGKWQYDVALSDGTAFHFSAQRTWLASLPPDATCFVGNFDGDPQGRSDLLLTYADAGGWHNEVVLSNGSAFDETSRSDWLPKVGSKAQYLVGNFDGDEQGRSDVLFSFIDQGEMERYRLAISNGHSFVLGEKLDGAFPDDGRLGRHVGDFDGNVPKRDDVLAAGPQTILGVQPVCWAPTQPKRMGRLSWVENAFELLDKPREWYLDEETPCPNEDSRCMYYIPDRREDLASHPVEAATLETLVRGHGDPAADRWLHDIQFRGVTFAFATWLEPSSSKGYVEIQAGWHGASPQVWTRTPGNLTFARAKSLVFADNVFAHLGAVGLNFDTASQDNVIEGNVFTDISSTAIQLGDVDDFASPPSLANRGNLIANNFLSKVAVEYESGVGVWAGYVRDTVIRNNEIGNVPYTGISLGWGWGASSYAGNNQLTANFIHDAMSILHDGGAIYTQSPQPSSTVSRNYIMNSGHIGVYHDDGSAHFSDTQNVITKVRAWLAFGKTTRDNRSFDNWIDYDNYQCGESNSHHGSAKDCSSDGNRIENNHFTRSDSWPQAAQRVIDAAGLESKYRALRNGVCGDATCASNETRSSCPKDCQ